MLLSYSRTYFLIDPKTLVAAVAMVVGLLQQFVVHSQPEVSISQTSLANTIPCSLEQYPLLDSRRIYLLRKCTGEGIQLRLLVWRSRFGREYDMLQ